MLTALALLAAAQAPVAPEGHVLAWSDEFETPGAPDPSRWSYDTVANKTGWYNNELQYYSAGRPENARVENGLLVIEARQEPTDAFSDTGGQGYTSARLLSPVDAGMRYGFYEIRAKLPCGRGTWPAIWMLSEKSIGWPLSGEIDIMEHVGHQPGTIHGTVHTDAYNHVKGTHKGTSTEVPTACDAFHRYQLRWTPEAIEIGVDDRRYFHFANDGRGDPKTWPFNRPFRILLNIAVGGDWGGQQGVDDKAFPARMEVDYVRYYLPNAD